MIKLEREPRTVNLNGDVYSLDDIELVEWDGGAESLSAFYKSDTLYVHTTDGYVHDVERADLDTRTEFLLDEFVQTM